MRLTPIDLTDNYTRSGEDLDKFRGEIQKLTESTKYIRTSTAELAIEKIAIPGSKKVVFQEINPDTVIAMEDAGVYDQEANKHEHPREKVNEDLFKEAVNGPGFLIRKDDSFLYISSNALSSLFARANLAGDEIFRPTFARDVLLMQGMYFAGIGDRARGRHKVRDRKNNPEDYNCTLVVRSVYENGKEIQKVFFVPTEKYAPVPLTVLSDVADAICDDDILGRPEVKFWRVDHELAEIVITFPEKGEELKEVYKLPHAVIPGVLIRSSDTGKSCVDIKSVAFLEKGRRYMILETAKRKHAGIIDADEIIETADAIVLKNLRRLPETMMKLIERPVYEPTEGKEFSEVENRKAVEKMVSDVLRKVKLSPVIGKKRELPLKNAIKAEINPSVPYTHYDIAMMLMSIPDRIEGLTRVSTEGLANLTAEIPFVIEKMGDEEDEEEIVLLPEE